jgi:hypothetical protein
MKLLKINTETGMFIEDVILPSVPTVTVNDPDGNPAQIPDPQYITTPCPAGFYWPRWDGEKWVEGGEAPVPVEPEPTDSEVLADLIQLLVDKEVIY